MFCARDDCGLLGEMLSSLGINKLIDHATVD